MKKSLIVIALLFLAMLFMSVNSVTSHDLHEYATVDTDPAAAGFWTNEVSIRVAKSNRRADEVYFSIRGTGLMTVTLQFKCFGDATWTDYNTYTTVTRLVIEGGAAGELWRAGVKDADYTSGNMTFGFDW